MPSLSPSPVLRALEQSAMREPLNLRRILSLLKQARFDGSITLHFRGGRPHTAELGRPIQIELQPEADGDSLPRLTSAQSSMHTPT